MQQWYHSGLEGYCKAAAQLMGLPDNNSGWGNFGRDLFADGRFDDPVKASKTWTLSRFRHQGRSNRPRLFEESWLGKSGAAYELDAIHACVHEIGHDSADSALYDLYHHEAEQFAQSFREIVIPAIEDGFTTERYDPSSVVRFSQGLHKALDQLDPKLPQTFRSFAVPLVAGLIYGPDHAVAQSSSSTATLRTSLRKSADQIEPLQVDMGRLRLSLILSSDLGIIDHTAVISEDSVVLLGRNSEIATYTKVCNPAFVDVLNERDPIGFPISREHKLTSKEHGIIVRIGETWYFHDCSANGSFLKNADRITPVKGGVVALQPGDTICLGMTQLASTDVERFRLATTLHVAFAPLY